MVVSALPRPDPDSEFTVMWVSDKRLMPPLEPHRGQATKSQPFFDWVTTRTLRSAADLLTRDHFDAILIQLPFAGEVQAVAELKAGSPGLPILVLLESGDSELSQQAYRQGADAVMLQSDPALDRLLPEFLVAAAHRRRADGHRQMQSQAVQSTSTQTEMSELLEAMPLPSVVVDLQGQVLHANGAAQREFHTDAQGFGAVRLKSLPAPGGSAEQVIELPGGSFTCRLFAREISWRGTRALLLNLLNLAGIPTKKELEEREQRVREYELRFSGLTELVKDAVVLFDRKGKAIYRSPQFNRLYPGPESTLAQPQDLLEPDDGAKLSAEIARMLEGKSRHLVRLELRTKPLRGRQRWVEVELSDYGLGGAGIGAVMMLQRDISELRETRDHYQLLAENLDDLVIVTTPDGTVLYDSPSMIRLFGERPGRNLLVQSALTHPDDRDKVALTFRSALNAKESVRLDLRFQMPGGQIRWFDASLRMIADENDHGRILIVLRDITARKALEERLAASERLFRTMVEVNGDLIQVVDSQGHLVYASPTHYRYFQTVPGTTLGKPIGGHVHPEDRERVFDLLRRGLSGEAMESKHRLVLADGSIRWVHLRGYPLFDANGKPDGGLAVNTDITDIVEQSDEAISRARFGQQTRVAALLDLSQALVYEADPDGVLVYVNTQFCEFLGRSREALLGRPVVEFIDASQRELVRRRIREQASGVLPLFSITERQYVTADDRRVWLRGSGVVLHDEQGKVSGTLVIGHDTTERLAQELQLRHALDSAREAEQAKSDFLAVASHELRTPLNAMVGTLYQLGQGPLAQAQAERLQRLQRSAARLKALLDDILDLSRLESSQVPLLSERFSLATLAQEVRSMFSDQASAKGLELDVWVQQSQEVLLGDELRLGQALINLVGNAIKFTERGAVRVRLSGEPLDDAHIELRIEVQDSGPGLSAEQRAGLFRPFAQADRRQSARLGGTGLGLAIVRRIAQAMDGEVGVESEPGAGSTFWMTARLARDSAATNASTVMPDAAHGDGSAQSGSSEPELTGQQAKERLASRFSGSSVLLVEDEAITQLVMTELLEMAGLTVTVVDDGVPALQRMRSGLAPALILMDMQMLEMDGVQTTREIRALPGGEHWPIIGMSANAYESDRRACLEAGMNHFMAKPIDPDALYRLLLRVLQG